MDETYVFKRKKNNSNQICFLIFENKKKQKTRRRPDTAKTYVLTGNVGDCCDIFVMAHSILAKVWSIVVFACYSMFHNPLVGSEVFTAVASIVAFAPTAVHQFLLRQPNQFATFEKIGAFNGTCSAKGPTTATHGLIFYRCNCTVQPPIDRVRHRLEWGDMVKLWIKHSSTTNGQLAAAAFSSKASKHFQLCFTSIG